MLKEERGPKKKAKSLRWKQGDESFFHVDNLEICRFLKDF